MDFRRRKTPSNVESFPLQKVADFALLIYKNSIHQLRMNCTSRYLTPTMWIYLITYQVTLFRPVGEEKVSIATLRIPPLEWITSNGILRSLPTYRAEPRYRPMCRGIWLTYIASAPDRSTRRNRKEQLNRPMPLVKGVAMVPALWGNCRPRAVTDAWAPFRAVPIVQSPTQRGMGGKRRAEQFIYGFDIVGRLSQMGAFRPDAKVQDQDGVSASFGTCRARFGTREENSGYKSPDLLWGGARKQVDSGWLTPPCPFW